MAGLVAKRKLRIHLPVFLALIGAAFLLAIIKLWGPMAVARHQQEGLARLRAEKASLKDENKQLEEYKRKLASDEGKEAAARRDGYVREGDRRLVFVKEKEKAKAKK
jgi:cell division protein FtsB